MWEEREGKRQGERWREGGEREREFLFMRVIDKHVCFFTSIPHPNERERERERVCTVIVRPIWKYMNISFE